MSGAPPPVAALAASLVPDRAAALLGRHRGVDPDSCRTLLEAPRADRLAALAEALRSGTEEGPSAAERSGGRPAVRGSSAAAQFTDRDPAVEPPARTVLRGEDMLPFDLPSVAPALAAVDGALLALGARAARSAALGLSSVLGSEATVRGRLLPGLPETAGVELVPIELTALAGVASLSVECAFAARLADRVAGGTGPGGVGGSLSAAERAVVELAVLGALDALSAEPGIETALAPRLGLRGGVPVRPICVELTISVAGAQGRALLTLPEAALRAVSRDPALSPPLADVPVRGWIRSGQAALDPAEAAALEPGDVLLLDPGAGETTSLHLAGGLEARGRLEGGSLEVEEVRLPGSGGAAEAGAAPVLLEVELATVAVPLRELARIAPGAVVPLGLDRSGRVTLRIGERAVATGELVEVDGAVGVRIGSLLEGP